ncbi:hypothetical protein SERLA73DRAFT_161493 [Serpula lacrymans var. lacrymans S7.3]|uniref:rRNA methyltransferase 2, mitochondrial n=2 Tax=Serpula lacrymans var. lacrymans TaxID=341189 RepID=F8Q2Q1_SERL3|nr:uncharacterized protein SERLADRAFT_450740 [Serpula lacrymans var. lacrymans S7.9]EGN97462.1 hypothetical protein SERLA73DRAFT_161493 [Serpula lacrymans var. lacrymans S7.3]EGO23054.1 hypothetical protein SERLADRAFT_450740 [Serpula lacrymans var. lacrymans S7.9]
MSFRPTAVVSKIKSSSQSWLSRQSRDPYVKQRQTNPASYRSRSAFKLIELDKKWGSFLPKNGTQTVVDLGAAPGGWSQVVAKKMGWTENFDDDLEDGDSLDFPNDGMFMRKDKNKSDNFDSWSYAEEDLELDRKQAPVKKAPSLGKSIVAVDLLPMLPIPGVQTLQLDFLSPEAGQIVKSMLLSDTNSSGKADVILSDMAANFTGNSIRDTESSLDICRAVFEFATGNLKKANETRSGRGGTLLLKHFAHPLLHEFRANHLEPNFHLVHYIKPEASRARSSEGYWLCRGWKGAKS